MKKLIYLLLAISTLVLSSCCGCLPSHPDMPKEITVGTTYLFYEEPDVQDPYAKPSDTVKVLEMDKEFVKFSYVQDSMGYWDDSQYQSGKIGMFKRQTRIMKK